MQAKLKKLFDQTPEILLCALYNINGETQEIFTKNSYKIDEGEKLRYAATTLASSALANRTLSILSLKDARFLIVKGQHLNAGIGIINQNYILVISDNKSDIKSLTLRAMEQYQN